MACVVLAFALILAVGAGIMSGRLYYRHRQIYRQHLKPEIDRPALGKMIGTDLPNSASVDRVRVYNRVESGEIAAFRTIVDASLLSELSPVRQWATTGPLEWQSCGGLLSINEFERIKKPGCSYERTARVCYGEGQQYHEFVETVHAICDDRLSPTLVLYIAASPLWYHEGLRLLSEPAPR